MPATAGIRMSSRAHAGHKQTTTGEDTMTRFRLTAIPFMTTAHLFACAAAHAQSSVAISGLVDIGVFRDFAKKNNVGTIQRSNIAFSGKEDLGDGWAATFNLSHRFEAATGQQEGVGFKP